MKVDDDDDGGDDENDDDVDDDENDDDDSIVCRLLGLVALPLGSPFQLRNADADADKCVIVLLPPIKVVSFWHLILQLCNCTGILL